ncbi:acyltransferase [Ottowia sp.]|jgi:peptidoglycan/LPS O-acetylase OafA/YrhL|uniref:acyltransferase family protein n=1 Tax=Ottowia sp. TaxID=1898956 RepID=UPI0025E85504|nr:acyltransferase [Ottowia sp.]MBK6614424.1 acyltransferase [Ottowia sp.]
MTSSAPRYQRNFGLDALRSVAITVVLMNHGFIGFFLSTGLSRWEGWRAALSACAVFSIEWLFVLSGFLIGSMMIRSFEARAGWWASARDFWLRRWFRTVPNYYLFLAINAALAWWGIEEGHFAWSFAVFSQNLAWAEAKPLFFAEAWSLALDEWFYFLMPLLLGCVAFLTRLDRRHLFWAAAGLLILLPSVLRSLMAVPPAHFFEWDDHVRRVTVMHLDATGYGVAAAILNRWHPAWWGRWQGGKAVLGALLMLGAAAAMFYFMLIDWRGFADGRFNDLALIVAPGVGTVLLLPWLANRQGGADWVRWLAGRIGDYSYSIYLCHMPLMLAMVYTLKALGVDIGPIVGWVVLAWVALVLILSALVFHGFEKPVSDLRERFTRRVQAGPFGGRGEG